jgi:hypothetical protein
VHEISIKMAQVFNLVWARLCTKSQIFHRPPAPYYLPGCLIHAGTVAGENSK